MKSDEILAARLGSADSIGNGVVMLKLGDHGIQVKELQRALYPRYYHGKIDGDFGPMTEEAVRAWQQEFYINGVMGSKDLRYLFDEVVYLTGKRASTPKIPKNRRELIKTFGKIEYVDTDKGRIRITNGWAKENIVKVDLPIVGKKWVHRKLTEVFVNALVRVERAGIAEQIKQFGTWAPRHILHNPKKPLSLHSYGIAVDINARENRYGQEKCNIHPVIVESFKSEGFTWGGDWKRPDPMHLEYYARGEK